MAVTFTRYANERLLRCKGLLDLRSTDIKLALLTDAYTPDMEIDAVWADVSTHEVEASGGTPETNYTAGGEQITTLALDLTGEVVTWTGDNVTFSNLDAEIKYGVIYLDDTVDPSGADEAVKPLIALIDFDNSSTSSTLTIPGVDFLVPWHVDGISVFGPCAAVCI